MFRSLLSRLSGRFVGRRVPSPAPSPSSPPTLLRPAGAEKESGKSIHIGPDVVLYRSAANVLKTDDTFDAKDLKIEGKDIFHRLIESYLSYHTHFESLDGLYASSSGSGGVASYQGRYVRIYTGTTKGSHAELAKMVYYPAVPYTWDKQRVFVTRIYVSSISSVPGDVFFVVMGYRGSGYRKVGFKAEGNGSNMTLYGIVGDGSADATVSLRTISSGEQLKLMAVLYPGQKAEFYVNDTLEGTLTTRIPSGSAYAYYLMDVMVWNPESSNSIEVRLSEWAFLQLP